MGKNVANCLRLFPAVGILAGFAFFGAACGTDRKASTTTDAGGEADGAVEAGTDADADADAETDGGLLTDGGAQTTTAIRVHFHGGPGDRIALRGAPPAFSWDAATELGLHEGDVWTYLTTEVEAPAEIIPMLVHSDGTEHTALGSNWIVHAGALP